MAVNPLKLPRKSEKLPPPSQRTLAQSWLGMLYTPQKTTTHLLHCKYQALPARTRLFVSLGLCIVGGTGLMFSNFLETSMPPKPAQSVDH